MTKKNLKFTCYVAVVLFILLRFFFDTLDALSYAVSAAALVSVAYDKFLWRFNPFEETPRLFGVYDEINHSSYDGGHDYTATATICQTLSSITIYEEVEGSGYCESITASLVKSPSDGVWKLYYTYRTHPNIGKNDDMHEGTAILLVKDKNKLTGTYFTNRLQPTKGNTTLIKRSK